MCERTVGTYTRAGLLAAVTVFEERTGMSSEVFEQRFRAGEIDDAFYANVWHQLLEELRDYGPDADDVDDAGVIEQARTLAPERAGV